MVRTLTNVFFLCLFLCPVADLDNIHLLQLQSALQRGSHVASMTADIAQFGPGDDAVKYCGSEELVIGEPSVNNLDGGSDGPKLIRYPEVKPGVDLIIEADGDYVPKDASQNGFNGGFGNLNMKTGTATNFKFTFVQAGTTDAVVVPQVSLSFFDMDEGKRGRGRGTLESCGTSASFITSSTELVQQFKDDCVKTTTCKRGAKKNQPPTPYALTNDHLKRSMTMSYEGKSSVTVRWSLGKGQAGRNLMFSLTAPLACAKTTTTTTSAIPTTQPVPHCPLPKAPFKWCRGRDDPSYDKLFLGGKGRPNADTGYHTHMSYGVFWAARTKDGGGVQVFHVPIHTAFAKDRHIASIGGVAIKTGNDIVTYTPTTFENTSGTVKVMVNGVEYKATDVRQKTPSGFVTSIPKNDPKHVIAWDINDIDGLCVTDDAQTLQVKIAKRKNYNTGVEFQLSLNMNEDVMDTRNSGEFGPGGKYGGGYGQICMDGGAGYTGGAAKIKDGVSDQATTMAVEYDVHNSQRVKSDESWFGAREYGEICDNVMNFHGFTRDWVGKASRDEYTTDQSKLAGCDAAELMYEEQQSKIQSPHSTQELCVANDLSWDDAQNACANLKKPAFKQACLWEYCNDFGDADAAKIAVGVEEDAEAAQASADESHQNELNFTPEECCLDDLDCDKEFSLSD